MQDLRNDPAVSVPFGLHPLPRTAADMVARQWEGSTLADIDQLAARVDEIQQALINVGGRLGPVADFAAALPADAIRTMAQHWLDTATDVPLETRRAAYGSLIRWLDKQPL